MPLDGFREIWEVLNKLDEEKLDEFADYKRGTDKGVGITQEEYRQIRRDIYKRRRISIR